MVPGMRRIFGGDVGVNFAWANCWVSFEEETVCLFFCLRPQVRGHLPLQKQEDLEDLRTKNP